MSFIRECDFEYTAYFEQFQVYRLLASIKRTSGCEPIPHMGLQTLTDELTAFTPWLQPRVTLGITAKEVDI